MPNKAVVDTNVWVSYFINQRINYLISWFLEHDVEVTCTLEVASDLVASDPNADGMTTRELDLPLQRMVIDQPCLLVIFGCHGGPKLADDLVHHFLRVVVSVMSGLTFLVVVTIVARLGFHLVLDCIRKHNLTIRIFIKLS